MKIVIDIEFPDGAYGKDSAIIRVLNDLQGLFINGYVKHTERDTRSLWTNIYGDDLKQHCIDYDVRIVQEESVSK